jgi:hypothetical protein
VAAGVSDEQTVVRGCRVVRGERGIEATVRVDRDGVVSNAMNHHDRTGSDLLGSVKRIEFADAWRAGMSEPSVSRSGSRGTPRA